MLRVIKPIHSSTQVVHVETDAGEAFLKGPGPQQGSEALAFDLVGTRLARLCGLFTPDFAVIDNDRLEIRRFDGELVTPGPAFVSRALPGNTGGHEAFLSRLMNSHDVPLLVAFDTWIANTDHIHQLAIIMINQIGITYSLCA